MRYWVTKFHKATEQLISEVEFDGEHATDLARLFGVSPELFVDVYPVGYAEAEEISPRFGVEVDIESGDYFVEVTQ